LGVFLCDFCLDFSSFLFKKALPHGIIKPTRTCFYAAFKVQAGISGSAFLLSSSRVFLFLFVFVSQSLSLSLSLSFFFLTLFVFKSLSRRSFFLFFLIFPARIKELKPRRRRKRSREEVQHLIIISVLWWFC